MRIVIMGAGGLGGYFGARLAAAGNDVAFVARGAHLAAICVFPTWSQQTIPRHWRRPMW
jgi:ketopantoate reductase